MSEHENQENTNPQFQNPIQPSPYYYYPPASPAYYPMYNNTRQFQQAQQPQVQPQQQQAPGTNVPGMLPMQQSYIENILRLNRGKLATLYMTFEGGNPKTFTGIIEAAGRDHIVLSEPETGRRVLLLMIYLDYVVFNEEINYTYPYGGNQQMANYSPR